MADFALRQSFVNGTVVEMWVPLTIPDPYLPNNWLTSTLPRWAAINNQTPLAGNSGKLYWSAIYLPSGFTVTSVIFTSGTTALGTPVNWWFALGDNAGKVLATTADQLAAAWTASTQKNIALTAPYVTTYSGLYYLGIMVNATTMPSLYAESTSSVILGFSGGGIDRPYMTQIGGAGLTTPSVVGTTPFAFGSANVVAQWAWAAVA